jgi:hypothetical protein
MQAFPSQAPAAGAGATTATGTVSGRGGVVFDHVVFDHVVLMRVRVDHGEAVVASDQVVVEDLGLLLRCAVAAVFGIRQPAGRPAHPGEERTDPRPENAHVVAHSSAQPVTRPGSSGAADQR